MKLYTSLPSILTLQTLVLRTQAWPSANSAHRPSWILQCALCSLACHWRLRSVLRPFFLLSMARMIDARTRLCSSELSFSYGMDHQLTSSIIQLHVVLQQCCINILPSKILLYIFIYVVRDSPPTHIFFLKIIEKKSSVENNFLSKIILQILFWNLLFQGFYRDLTLLSTLVKSS